MTELGVDTPTLDRLVPLVPELVIGLIAFGGVLWLAWAILGVLDRELERRDGRRPPSDQLLDAMREQLGHVSDNRRPADRIPDGRHELEDPVDPEPGEPLP